MQGGAVSLAAGGSTVSRKGLSIHLSYSGLSSCQESAPLVPAIKCCTSLGMVGIMSGQRL